VLTDDERSEKYLKLILMRKQTEAFLQRVRDIPKYAQASSTTIHRTFRECPFCVAVVKRERFKAHREKCGVHDDHLLENRGSALEVGPRSRWAQKYEEMYTKPQVEWVQCSGLLCRFRSVRHRMWLHKCEDVEIKCRGCGEVKTRRAMAEEGHPNFDCWNNPLLKCPFHCGLSRYGLTRQKWADHQLRCAKTLVRCELCGRQVQEKYLKYHRKESLPLYFGGFVTGGGNLEQPYNQPMVYTTCLLRSYFRGLPDEAFGN